MKIEKLIPTNYIEGISHLSKDRTNIRERWDRLSENSNMNINRKMLICSMFKDSALWIDDIFKCINDLLEYNDKQSNDNKLLIKLAFLESPSKDNTSEILKSYITSLSSKIKTKIWHHKFNNESDIVSRYEKLAWFRNYIISESTKNINLKDDDIILLWTVM